MDAVRRNAGLVLVQTKYAELNVIITKSTRAAQLYHRWKAAHKPIEVNYTEENLETLVYHSFQAFLSNNFYMLHFWGACCQYIKDELESEIQRDLRFRHQIERIVKVHSALVKQGKDLGDEIHQLRISLERG